MTVSSEENAFADFLDFFEAWKRDIECRMTDDYLDAHPEAERPSSSEKAWFSEFNYIYTQYHDKLGIYEPR